jgi:hypothetical protein
MSRKARQSTDWKFRVVQEPLERKGKIIPNLFGNFREDTGECLGSTSDQYGLIQNEDILDAAKAAMSARGMKDFKESIVIAGGGARMYASYTFEDRTLATEKGDLFGYQITVQNSFDRSLRGSIVLGFRRLICSNGMATTEKDFALTAKHSSRVSVDFVGKAIDKAMSHGSHALQAFDTMAKIKITPEQGMNILKHLEQSKIISGSLREGISTLWLSPRRKEDMARTIYNLYNAITEYVTHQVAKERFEYANKVSNQTLFSLVNATRNQEKLAKLIVPVPESGVSITVNADTIAEAAGLPEPQLA